MLPTHTLPTHTIPTHTIPTQLNQSQPLDRFQCHMYENKLPKEGDLVMVKIIQVEDNGAQCQLLEYGNIEGLLPNTEYSRKRIRSIKKLVKPGNKDVLTVLRVDTEKQYIDLSKKHVTPAEKEQVSSRFSKSNYVHSTLRQLCVTHDDITLHDVYESIGWPLSNRYGHAFDGLEKAARDLTILDALDLDGNIRAELRKSIEHKFQEKPKDVKCIITLTCIGIDGVNTIKNILLNVQSECNKNSLEPTIEITVISCPDYSIAACGINTESITQRFEQAILSIQKQIESIDGGGFAIKQQIQIQ